MTIEEHQVVGGMGSAIAELLAKKYPTQMEFIGVQNKFGQSGKSEELLEYYGMSEKHIKEAVKNILKKR